MNAANNGDGGLDPGLLNLRWAQAFVHGLWSQGLRQVVISPGSRSTPLALTFSRHPEITTWIQDDERCAAFFALGLARENAEPVALVCTSGSAAAHWLPAVIEANLSTIPLLLLTANRPPESWGWGANQTIDQSHLFSGQIRAFHQLPPAEDNAGMLRYVRQLGQRAFSESRWPVPGPVHLDIPFREPLLPLSNSDLAVDDEVDTAPAPAPAQKYAAPVVQCNDAQIKHLAERLNNGKGIIVAGPDSGSGAYQPALLKLAERLQVPVLADPLSGLRFGSVHSAKCITTYDAFLRNKTFCARHQPDWILRFGAMPVSKTLSEYLAGCGAAYQILIDPMACWRDPLQQTDEQVIADNAAVCKQLMQQSLQATPEDWLSDFQQQETNALQQAEACCDEAVLIQALVKALPSASLLFSANSLPIRDLDSFSGGSEKKLRIIANRGASGIDGNVSTLAGLAAAIKQKSASAPASAPVVGLLGDLACYHDMNGLRTLRDEFNDEQVLIIVINNGGGGIFYHLPQARLPEFERLWLTPHGLDFSKVAELYDLQFYRVQNLSDFSSVLTQAMNRKRCQMIEVMIDPQRSLVQHQAYWSQFTDSK